MTTLAFVVLTIKVVLGELRTCCELVLALGVPVLAAGFALDGWNEASQPMFTQMGGVPERTDVDLDWSRYHAVLLAH